MTIIGEIIMLKIKDYLILKNVEVYLENKHQEMLRENNQYINEPIVEIKNILDELNEVLKKLENEVRGRIWIKIFK